MISKDTLVEDIVNIDGVIPYFLQHRVSPITCSGIFPQSLGKLLKIKKVEDPDAFIAELNTFLSEHTK